MNKKEIISFIAATLITFSFSAQALEDLVIHSVYQPEIVPFDFVVDAGISVQKYVQNPIYQKIFILEYSSTLKEILFYKMKISDFDEDEDECKKTKDENHKALACSRVAAAKAVFEKKIPLDIESFGFVKKTFLGKIKKINDGHGDFLVLKTNNGDRWECILDKKEKYSEDILYTIEGFLSIEGAYGTRGDILEREFLVTNLTAVKK